MAMPDDAPRSQTPAPVSGTADVPGGATPTAATAPTKGAARDEIVCPIGDRVGQDFAILGPRSTAPSHDPPEPGPLVPFDDDFILRPKPEPNRTTPTPGATTPPQKPSSMPTRIFD